MLMLLHSVILNNVRRLVHRIQGDRYDLRVDTCTYMTLITNQRVILLLLHLFFNVCTFIIFTVLS